MELPLEAVPNFSEGRDAGTLDALRGAFGRVDLLDVHADADHNRSVFTAVGEDSALVESLLRAVAVAVERIDLRRHDGRAPTGRRCRRRPARPDQAGRDAAGAGGGPRGRRADRR